MKLKALKSSILALGVAAIFASCGAQKNENPTGSWTSAAPESVTENIPGASSAMKTMTFDFKAPEGNEGGKITVTADYDVTLATPTEQGVSSYKANAKIDGTWTKDDHDDDEYNLALDKNSLVVWAADAPELGPVTDNFLKTVSQLTKIEDVKVSKDGSSISFESDHPEIKYQLVKK